MQPRFFPGIAGAALLALAGCGGVVDAPQCSFFSNVCNPTFDDVVPFLLATVHPPQQTVQVGATATFSAAVNVGAVSYQWRRSSDGGLHFVDIPGATGPTYSLAGTQTVDDGTVLLVEVKSGGLSAQAAGKLVVSSMPGVVFQDGEFLAGDWAAVAVASPASGAPTHVEEQAGSAGVPGAFRQMTHAMPAGAASLLVLHSARTAVYDPASLGAVYVIDFTEDCILFGANPSTTYVASSLLLEQGGRRYTAKALNGCSQPVWLSLTPRLSLVAADLQQVDGPACGAGEACPDFSATAAPLRFGYARSSQQGSGSPATLVHGIDNWKVVVWRR